MNLLKRFNYSLILLVLTIALFNCTGKDSVNAKDNTNPKESENMNIHLTTDNYVRDIVNHPAFKGFGELLLPFDNNTGYYNPACKCRVSYAVLWKYTTGYCIGCGQLHAR